MYIRFFNSRNRLAKIALTFLIGFLLPVYANEDAGEFDINITELTIEDILNTKIQDIINRKFMLASKKAKKISQVPTAAYILTADDIRRSGATSIPEALRLVPGVEVARLDANKWAVSIRGFNSRTANKLLVLIDGRSIYDLRFSGVVWETKDVLLEDVDRIEVIRGPGGTIWGANAVNGVINIITKSAKDTTGGLAVGGGGTEELGFKSFRYGFELSEDQFLRIYGKSIHRDAGFLEQGADDDSESTQFGFRYDGYFSEKNSVTLQGDYYDGQQGTPDSSILGDSNTSGFNLLGRWNRKQEKFGDTSLMFYFDHTELVNPLLGESRDTFNIDFQHALPVFGAHSFIWGATYRTSEDEIDNISSLLSIFPESRTDVTTSFFVQDEISLYDEKMFLTLGSKFEKNDYTGNETQPNIRFAWHINDTDVLWAAVSKAVRIPSRVEADLFIQLPIGQSFTGSRTMRAEELIAYEAGYRFSPAGKSYIDISVFNNHYSDLLSIERITIDNKMFGKTYGAEISATYIPSSKWKLISGYSFLDLDLEIEKDSLSDPNTVLLLEETDPESQFFTHLSFTPTPQYEMDFILRHVDDLVAQDVPAYTVMDLRFEYKLNDDFTISFVAQNVFDSPHPEQSEVQLSSQVEDGYYMKVLYEF